MATGHDRAESSVTLAGIRSSDIKPVSLGLFSCTWMVGLVATRPTIRCPDRTGNGWSDVIVGSRVGFGMGRPTPLHAWPVTPVCSTRTASGPPQHPRIGDVYSSLHDRLPADLDGSRCSAPGRRLDDELGADLRGDPFPCRYRGRSGTGWSCLCCKRTTAQSW
jgi:hypothetical protein